MAHGIANTENCLFAVRTSLASAAAYTKNVIFHKKKSFSDTRERARLFFLWPIFKDVHVISLCRFMRARALLMKCSGTGVSYLLPAHCTVRVYL